MYIYGKNVAREKLKTTSPIRKAYLSTTFKDQEIINLLRERKTKIQFLKPIALDKKVSGIHQGIILEIDEVETISLDYFWKLIQEKKNPIVVMLDHLEDPHNFGAIIRTCEALGIDGIIIPNDRSVGINDTVVKTSAGAIYHLPLIRVPNLANTVEKLKKHGFWIVGTDMKGEDYTKLDYNMPICLIIGNEGHGMSKILRDNCDFMAKIPMTGQINSLNASVSCGILLSRITSSRSL